MDFTAVLGAIQECRVERDVLKVDRDVLCAIHELRSDIISAIERNPAHVNPSELHNSPPQRAASRRPAGASKKSARPSQSFTVDLQALNDSDSNSGEEYDMALPRESVAMMPG